MNAPEIHWSWKRFSELNVQQWHDLLQLRINVFVVEQNCPYPELDGKDAESIHVIGTIDNHIIATARILPPGLSYPEVSIGRVAVHEDWRNKGIGLQLMNCCLQAIEQEFGKAPIRISAQTYLKAFYLNLGFKDVDNYYLEDDIPHLEMLRE